MESLRRVDVDAVEARHAYGPASEDVAVLAAEVRRLRAVLIKEATERGAWAREASRLIEVVESGARFRAQMVRGARDGMQRRCAAVVRAAIERGNDSFMGVLAGVEAEILAIGET